MNVHLPGSRQQAISRCIGRFVSLVLLTVGGGLLQLWVTLILLAELDSLKVTTLLGDGGVFFFSTSLIYTSILTFLSKKEFKIGTLSFNLTVPLVASVTLYTVIVYAVCQVKACVPSAAAETDGMMRTLPFADHWVPQIICGSAAIVYAVYVCTEVGFFWETPE